MRKKHSKPILNRVQNSTFLALITQNKEGERREESVVDAKRSKQRLGKILTLLYVIIESIFLCICWLICGLVWLWSLVRTKDVKNDMWVVKGKFCQNFPRPLSLF